MKQSVAIIIITLSFLAYGINLVSGAITPVANCATCAIDATTKVATCKSCKPNFYLKSDGTCVALTGCATSDAGFCKTCYDLYFISAEGTATAACTACKDNCKTCTTTTDCTVCAQDYFLSGPNACSEKTGCISSVTGSTYKCDQCVVGKFWDGEGEACTDNTGCSASENNICSSCASKSITIAKSRNLNKKYLV